MADFIRKWGPGGVAAGLSERAGAQLHFLDVCRVLGVEEPADPDSYCFERGFRKATNTRGFADVWKRGFFAWEYKAPKGDLTAALQQLIQYALPLDNPPLLVVCNRLKFEIHTHFTGHPSQVTSFSITDLRDPQILDILRAVFVEPYRFKPQRSNRDITEDAAAAFAGIADRLRDRGVDAKRAAHFLTQCVFCLFAEDTQLLRDNVFKRLLQRKAPTAAMRKGLADLFAVMKSGGSFGADDIEWFNGGLFNEVDVPDLDEKDLHSLRNATRLNWRAIDPSIFGTLFERGLDPSKRAQLGAHYTDPLTITRLVEPTVKTPLLVEWERTRGKIAQLLARRDYLRSRAKGISSKSPSLKTRYARIRTDANAAEKAAQAAFSGYLEKLRNFTVLDPACGSGNFLYVSLKCLKDIEHLVNIEAEQLGLQRQLPVTGPQNVVGLEVNEFAAELARVTVWIGELQWLLDHGYGCNSRPVLRPLNHIENRDALLSPEGSEASWPKASVVVGNPPFLGDKKMRAELGGQYTSALRRQYIGRVPGGADLVCYWFEKARAAIVCDGLGAAGLVATNSIRGGRNRRILNAITESTRIFEAWSDQPWVNDGAAVRVSLIAFGNSAQQPKLDGSQVEVIHSDLTAGGRAYAAVDVTRASVINPSGVSFIGTQKGGSFEITASVAQEWLRMPNPNGRSNSDVLKPWVNGLDLVRRSNNLWIIDFGTAMNEQVAAQYELPFAHVSENVRPARTGLGRLNHARYWWRHAESRPGMRNALRGLDRYIATARVAKYRVFVWLPVSVLPDSQVVVIARPDDCTFGVLQCRFHTLWSLRLGTSLEDRPRYTPTSCFETYPFPQGLSPVETASQQTVSTSTGARVPANSRGRRRALVEGIAEAARTLVALRDAWLNPPQWAERVPTLIPRVNPPVYRAKHGHEEELSLRTMTALYNAQPQWLKDAHARLDLAVAAAYGWSDYTPAMPDEEVLRRLLVLNQLPSSGAAKLL